MSLIGSGLGSVGRIGDSGQGRAVPLIELRRRAERAAKGTAFHNDIAGDFERSRSVIGGITVGEIRTGGPGSVRGVVDRGMPGFAVAGSGGENGAIGTQNGWSYLEAASALLAIRIPELIDGA